MSDSRTDVRQRWRLVVSRNGPARDVAHREIQAAWEVALRSTGLPLAESAGRRGPVAFAAPVPVGMAAERELLDVLLAERRTRHEVRRAILSALPDGHALFDLYDVWIGAPGLAGQVVAADYRAGIRRPVETESRSDFDPNEIRRAIVALLETPRLEREREKAGSAVTIDIRPQIIRLGLRDIAAGDEPVVEMRLRLGGDRGAGRPEEVITAIAGVLGCSIEADIVRERIVLSTDGDASNPTD